MRILSIDTTSMLGSVAVSDDADLIAELSHGTAITHSERLVVSIDHLLTISKLKRDDIEGIAVATGPGSFTGLRIGLGVAKGIALALGIPVVGVSSLEALALNGEGFPWTIVTVIDARRKEIYGACWQLGKGLRPKKVLKESVLPPDAFISKIKKIKGPLFLVGDGAFEYGDAIKKAIGARLKIATGLRLYPCALNLAMLARDRFKKGKTDDIATLIPNYIRLSDAEIGFLGRKKNDDKA